MPRLNTAPSWQTALVVLSITVTATTLVAVLYVAQLLFIPVVLAIFLTFLLAPVVSLLQRLKLGRRPSVVLVILLVALMLGGAAWMISVQVKNLVDELPGHTENINGKLRGLRALGEGNTFGQLQEMARNIADAWHLRLDTPHALVPEPSSTPMAVLVEPSGRDWVGQVAARLGSVVTPLAHLALALVLSFFMLIRREALRNRLIHLVGDGSMTAATKAVDDASARISRYLRAQFMINSSFGLLWGTGLYVIGLDYFILWGFLGAALRYIPYLGASLAALLPLMLSLAQFPGWWPTIMILALLLAMELMCNNVIEPWLYGQSIGVSEVAIMISSAFWALLWGPIGLILAAPLTVCLMVLGNYVRQLKFLAVLLGDQAALSTDVSFYQRLLAHDGEEALRLAREKLDDSSLAEVFDEMIVPALVHAKRDREREEIVDENEGDLIESIRAIVDELRKPPEPENDAGPANTAPAPAPGGALSVLAYPARDEEDRVALELLLHLLDPALWNVNVVLPDALLEDVLEDCGENMPALVCVGALPPGGLVNTRALCARLLSRCEELPVMVGRWGLRDGAEVSLGQLRDGGASAAATTLAETCRQLEEWRPELLARAQARTGVTASTASGAASPCDDDKTYPRGCLEFTLTRYHSDTGTPNVNARPESGRAYGNSAKDVRLSPVPAPPIQAKQKLEKGTLQMSYTNDTMTKPDDGVSKIADAAKEGARTAAADARTAGEHLRESAADVIDAVKESAHEMSESASEMAGRAKDRAGEFASKAGDAAIHAKDRAQGAVSDAAGVASDLGEETTALIRRHPLTALAAGVALGFLLGQAARGPSNT